MRWEIVNENFDIDLKKKTESNADKFHAAIELRLQRARLVDNHIEQKKYKVDILCVFFNFDRMAATGSCARYEWASFIHIYTRELDNIADHHVFLLTHEWRSHLLSLHRLSSLHGRGEFWEFLNTQLPFHIVAAPGWVRWNFLKWKNRFFTRTFPLIVRCFCSTHPELVLVMQSDKNSQFSMSQYWVKIKFSPSITRSLCQHHIDLATFECRMSVNKNMWGE